MTTLTVSPESISNPIDGFEARSALSPLSHRREINIFYMHGIGWTQQTGDFAGDFTASLVSAYDIGGPVPDVSSPCPTSLGAGSQVGGLRIRAPETRIYVGDLASHQLTMTHLGCIDKQSIDTGAIRYNIYRFFWDDSFWNGLQFAHLGYDDAFLPDDPTPPNQRIADHRRPVNRDLKDRVVTYGFSDAAMYIGPAGELIRSAGAAAICIAIRDAAGGGFSELGQFEQDQFEQNLRVIASDDACAVPTEHVAPFAFVSESLGSRVIFDVLRDARRPGPDTPLTALLSQRPEVFMLANQIPLIGLGRLDNDGVGVARDASFAPAAKLVAISEVNDLLTFELVPYVQGLARRSDQVLHRQTPASPGELVAEFGFEVVDVRVEFAGSFYGFVFPFADPDQAHAGHVEQHFVMRLMICGTGSASSAQSQPCARYTRERESLKERVARAM